ncbi:hypothetical protein CDG77_20910 [Nostoc sp. 'Peltigera membranacea cyanobiont' 213]|uniref:hypothetical protein n=1 Tax=Nostoc sp. 'Peltigera membranacea cyanobiont' 213 TaxID=2014530 RepID=UPI000B9528BF|nr:hypothetical protein [Nostoc sp. 'Peltigera membranacea cyanobiont' 213]OYD88962.1 hypothetical protein CDG77_20910 [Nostoc sp. 'Peltigera membranacea cyanobiont' 213]
MSNNKFKEYVPSVQTKLLTQIKKHKISKLVRYSWLSPEEASKEWDIPRSSVFRLTAGTLLITLETNLIVGFSSLPEKASITVWLEKTEEGEQDKETSIINDDELYSIDSCDQVYSEQSICELLNRQVRTIKILKKEPENILLAQLPCEAGLLIEFNNGTELVLSHGLHDNSDDFAIIFKHEIRPDILDKLQEIEA